MFEFHAWATIWVNDDDDADMDVIIAREDKAIGQLQLTINRHSDNFSFFDLRRTGNGMIVFTAHGLRNHKFTAIEEIFEWIANNLPDSYGLLYTHDDDQENHFVVYRLALGTVTSQHDTLLSPCIPTIEKPCQP
ncbi:MAG: Imm7 family immunity protein [Cyanobacteria bacterium J06643_4]